MKTKKQADQEIVSGSVRCFHGSVESVGDFTECCRREFYRAFPTDRCLWFLLGDSIRADRLLALRAASNLLKPRDMISLVEALPEALRLQSWIHTQVGEFFSPMSLSVFETEEELFKKIPDFGPVPFTLSPEKIKAIATLGKDVLETKVLRAFASKGGWFHIMCSNRETYTARELGMRAWVWDVFGFLADHVHAESPVLTARSLKPGPCSEIWFRMLTLGSGTLVP